ncbi:hypothetical protein DL546_009680 [Coniochaeta pulveracea]|uniref:Transcription factor CBF/NF-Y/archaeal histone domain-containing protein n=1 Tax=Coniochaeta pulveracea TaxID=177199 RepID=A0A420YMA6_9PEZI|nr:hypothetical protein DL546_009680 [Coniochaeta pulveracea]
MPYNTTAIPPRKEVTGQTQLPLTRVKKIVSMDTEINTCSNNAAFVITLATEMFIQYLAEQAQNEAKTERKPRRNVQYKDLANAVLHHDNLEFLEDTIPKTAPYKAVKDQAAATRAKLQGKKPEGTGAEVAEAAGQPNGKKAKTNGSAKVNGNTTGARFVVDEEDPNAQLEMEMRQRGKPDGDDEDVNMTG